MTIVPYNPGMQIVNTAQLPRGTGARYLEVFDSHKAGELVAVCWRRVKPRTLAAGRALVEFTNRKKGK